MLLQMLSNETAVDLNSESHWQDQVPSIRLFKVVCMETLVIAHRSDNSDE